MPIGGMGQGSLGVARGSIVIDTSGAEQAAVAMRRVGQEVQRSVGGGLRSATNDVDNFIRSFRGTEKGVNDFINNFRAAGQEVEKTGSIGSRVASIIGGAFTRAGSALGSFADNVRAIRSELAAIGLAGTVLTKLGLDGARSIRNYRVTFTQLLGDQRQANELMRQLTDQANAFGIEVTEVWQLARALLPALEGDTEQLDEFVKRAALLASTNPLKSTADAARAIQEYLAGQTISLQRLFNVDPNLIQEAQAQFEGVGDQLDYILNRMGATEEGAIQMADSFVGVRNELKLLLAEGFTPLFQALQPILTGFREFISELRQSNPEVATFGATMAGIAAVGAPTLLFLGRVIESLRTIKSLSGAATLGRAGVLIGAAVGGAALGNVIGRGIGRLTGNEGAANTQLSDIGNIMKQLLFLAADSLSKLVVIIQDLVLKAAQVFVNGVASMVDGMGRFVNFIGNVLPDAIGGDKLREIGAGLSEWAANLRETAEQNRRLITEGTVQGQENFMRGLQEFLFPTTAKQEPAAAGGPALAPTGDGGFTDEQTDAIVAWWEQIREIEAQQAQARLDATRQYEEQRTELIDNYGRQMAREEEDFLRQRARQNAQIEKEIADIRQAQAEREQEWLADLNERVAEIRDEGNQRIAELEEDYNDQRERRLAEHQNRLLDAASRLDARAIAEEQRRFGLQETTAANELQKRTQQEKENLQERIEQEQEAHNERLIAAREADEERIDDMREALAEQQRIEDEDRAIRLRRIEEDHRRQLDALEDANRKRLIEIDNQAAKERTALDNKFQKELALMGLASADQLRFQNKAQNDALELFQDYWDDWNDIIKSNGSDGTTNPLKDSSKSKSKAFQSGGVVDYTGTASVHGSPGRPEFMLDADTTSMLRGMLGNFSQASLLTAVAGGSRGSTSVTLSDGAIQIFPAPGQSPVEIGMAVRSELAVLLQEVAG